MLSSGAKGADTDVDGQVRGPGEVGGHEHDGHQRVSNHEVIYIIFILNLLVILNLVTHVCTAVFASLAGKPMGAQP